MYQNVYKYDEMKRAEHMAVRTTVGWYLWTHNILEVTGRDAAAFLDKIYANPIANLKLGRAPLHYDSERKSGNIGRCRGFPLR